VPERRIIALLLNQQRGNANLRRRSRRRGQPFRAGPEFFVAGGYRGRISVWNGILTLPWLKHRGFFLQPATLRALTLPERVAGVCPEALRTF